MMRLFLKKFSFISNLLWINFSSNLTGSNVHQANFIRNANQILPILDYSVLDLEGECSSLVNLYILYDSEGRQDDFFSILKMVVHHTSQSILDESRIKIEEFMHRLMMIKRTDGIYLSSKKCTDAFSLITNDDLELAESVKKIIKKIQSMKQNVSMHVTLGYLHSFAIDQRLENGSYYYYVYDPNNSVLPQKISCLEDIVHEIQNALEKIKLSQGWRYFLYEDEAALFSFYIYPENEDDQLLSIFHQKLVKSPYKDDESVKGILHLIDLYRSNLIAKNIVLMQVLESMNKSPRIQFYFREDIGVIEQEMSHHLCSLSFNPVEHHKYKVSCFSYVRDYGHISLLHEAARIGDIAAVKALIPYSHLNHRSHQETYKTPIDWAIMGSHPLILELLLSESKKAQIKKSEIQNDEEIEHVVNCRSNAFNFSNTESKAMGHAIFSMFHLVRAKPMALSEPPRENCDDMIKVRADHKKQTIIRRYSL